MYRLIEHVWNGLDYDQKKLFEDDNLKEVMERAKAVLPRTESIRIEEGSYERIGDWETLKEFDDIDIRDYGKIAAIE